MQSGDAKPAASSRVVRDAKRGEDHTVAVNLSLAEHELVEQLARREQRDASEVIGEWARGRISDLVETFDKTSATASQELAIDVLKARVNGLESRVETFERHLGLLYRLLAQLESPAMLDYAENADAGSGIDQERRGGVTRGGRKVGSRKRRHSRRAKGPSLHEEIKAVLAASGRPMTSREIADQIRQRGRYSPARAEAPVTTAMVSARLSHPSYKSAFRRRGRLVDLSV